MITTKQGLSPHIALAYINGLYTQAADLLNDAEYYRAFKALEKRVFDMLETSYDGDIIDEYVIVERYKRGKRLPPKTSNCAANSKTKRQSRNAAK